MVANFQLIYFSCQQNLFQYAELVLTISTQLKIIASVKAATPDDETVTFNHNHIVVLVLSCSDLL